MNKSYNIEMASDGIVPIDKEQTILDASLSKGIMHFNACGGNAKCSTCRILVVDGEKSLTKPNEKEIALAKERDFPSNVRLACQTKVVGDNVRLKRIILDEFDMNLYLKENCNSILSGVGEEREMVLFFLDIRNFTPFIESHLTFDVVHVIRRLATSFRNIIHRNGGKIIEAAGDGFYAVFNWNKSITKAARDAVKSGNEIIADMKNFSENYMRRYFDTQLDVGIGIHTGKVIIGAMGFAGDDSLAVMGQAVNTASRLQNATKEINNNFIVSEDIFELLDGNKNYSSEDLKLKGLSKQIKVRLLGNQYNKIKN
jgi:adenylate cyclase